MAKHYDEAKVIASLERKSSVNVNRASKTVEILRGADDLGNGSWGKIDFLIHYCGYVYAYTGSINKRKNKSNNADIANTTNMIKLLMGVK